MNILSIQSSVAFGHVGNSAAVFALQRLGAEVCAIDTVQFSNHTGYGAWTGRVCPAPEIAALVDGVAQRGVLARSDAVLSGYVGDVGTGDAILDAVARVRADNPAALYACDPVIGDVGRGVFVRPGIAGMFERMAIPAADILTPNHFELALLTGRDATTLAGAKAAISAIRARMRQAGPRLVMVTSLVVEDVTPDSVELLVGSDAGFARLRTPRIGISVNGAGDLIAALLLFHVLAGSDAATAASSAVSSVWGVIEATRVADRRELALIAAQAELVQPSRRFAPVLC